MLVQREHIRKMRPPAENNNVCMLYMQHFFAELVVAYYHCSRTSTSMVHNHVFYVEIEHRALKPISVFTTMSYLQVFILLFVCFFLFLSLETYDSYLFAVFVARFVKKMKENTLSSKQLLAFCLPPSICTRTGANKMIN